VETAYLGMEHQSAVAYGNKYQKGYLGSDLSDTGIGLLFDFIIIHESGHEWFGNSITSKDIADMWIHEAFTCYSETVYIECQWGYEKAMRYVNGQANNVLNDIPIIGQYGVNNEGSSDMYYKGSLMLNTLRHVINDDAKWWKIILDYSHTYQHQIIDTETVIAFFNQASGMNLTPIFNQYLKYTSLPILEINKKGTQIIYRWKTEATNFEMPIDLMYKNRKMRLLATNEWKVLSVNAKSINDLNVLNDHFYIKVKKN
jgi:aminopeptidase N